MNEGWDCIHLPIKVREQIKLIFFLHLSSEHWKNENVVPGTEERWRGKGGGGRGAIRCVMCEVWGHLSSLSEEFAWNLRYSALGSKPLSFTHELAHGRGQPPVFQACIGQWTKYIGKIKTGASFPFDPGRISSACRAGGPGFDSRDRTNYQVLKLTENWRYCLSLARPCQLKSTLTFNEVLFCRRLEEVRRWGMC